MVRCNPRMLLNKALEALPGDVRQVLSLYYGLQDGQRSSFGGIAKALHIPLSRIVRMERQGTRKLRRPDLCVPLFDALDEMDSFIWSQISIKISDAGSLLPKVSSYDQALNGLQGEVSLLIRCRYETLSNWLQWNASETDSFWFRSPYKPQAVQDGVSRLCDIWPRHTPPIPLSILARQLDADEPLVRFLLALSPLKGGLYGGYAASRPISSSILRAIRLHRFFLYQWHGMPMPLSQIARDYNALYQDDQLNERMAQETMRLCPHLFLESDTNAWCGVGSIEDHVPYVEADDVVGESGGAEPAAHRKMPPHFYERPWSETTVLSILRDILEEKGIYPRVQIRKTFVARTHGRFKAVSTDIFLSYYHEFEEMAPQVFGLRQGEVSVDPLTTWTELLLTKRYCKFFVEQRYAGEPMNAYPLWTPAMEEHWCYWAEKDSKQNEMLPLSRDFQGAFASELFESLLYIAEPTNWPAPENVKKEWALKKQTLSRYHFARPLPVPFWKRWVTLQDLFSATLASKRAGYANWVRISAALRPGPDISHSARVLALLVALQIVLPSEHWQEPHAAGPQMDAAMLLMEAGIRKKGFVHWLDETGRYFKDRLMEKGDWTNLGWVHGHFIQQFLEMYESRKPSKQLSCSPPGRPLRRARRIKDGTDNGTDDHKEGPHTQLTLPFS